MNGIHLTADLAGCKTNHGLMTDAEKLRGICLEMVAISGLTAVHDLFYQFEPAENEVAGGVTGTVLLAESHLAIHTWPELSAVTLDVYVCNFSTDNRGKAQRLLESVINLFQPASALRQQIKRGRMGVITKAA
ncbi:MAG: adenosylmethionine decarboxylase [Burkholderiaceae bacterium]